MIIKQKIYMIENEAAPMRAISLGSGTHREDAREKSTGTAPGMGVLAPSLGDCLSEPTLDPHLKHT